MNFRITVDEVKPSREMPSDGRPLAEASIVLDNEFVVHNLQLVWEDKGLVVTLPSRETTEGTRAVVNPITDQCRQRIRTAILDAYAENLGPVINRRSGNSSSEYTGSPQKVRETSELNR